MQKKHHSVEAQPRTTTQVPPQSAAFQLSLSALSLQTGHTEALPIG